MKVLKIMTDVPSYIGIAFGSYGGLIFIASVMFEGIPSIDDWFIFVPILALPILSLLVVTHHRPMFFLFEATCIYAIAKMMLPPLVALAESVLENGDDYVIRKSNDVMQDPLGGPIVFLALVIFQGLRFFCGRQNVTKNGARND